MTPEDSDRLTATASLAPASARRRVAPVSVLLLGAALLAPFASVMAAQLAFLTSTTGLGKLADWPDAGGNSGLAAGDAICAARASAANLPDPQTFVAWLSDDTNDAYCRLHGFGGKKADNCGQATLPTGAGPWQRTDGMPFMGVIDQVPNTGAVYTPMNRDEFGHEIGTETFYAGTQRDGIATGRTCSGWTSNGGEVDIGQTTETQPGWTEFPGYTFCAQGYRRIACMQKGAGAPLELLPHARKQAFVTTATFSSNLGASALAAGNTGIAAGDAICRNVAQSANLEDAQSYKVYLAAGADPAAHFDNDGPWERIDRVPFADSFAQIHSDYTRAPLNVGETGAILTGQIAWNGLLADGAPAFQDCDHWTSTSFNWSGWTARLPTTGPHWPTSFASPDSCSTTLASLFCLSDSDRLFRDGLEK